MSKIKKVMSKGKPNDWRVLEYFVPIQESTTLDNDDFIIRGVAINETTTLNNVKYVAEELSKAASTFKNVPILLDHRNEVRNIVGRTTENVSFNDSMRRIDFEAKIMDKGIREMIKDGRIGSVSIGAKVEDLVEEEDGSMKAIGIKGLEISLVAVPGDSHANLAQAIRNSFHLKEMAMNGEDVELVEDNGDLVDEDEDKQTEKDTMSEEEEKKEESSESEETPSEEAPAEEAPKEEVASEKSPAPTAINVKVDTTEIADMKKQISELKELLVEKKKIQEKKMEDKTKGEVSESHEDALKKLDSLIVEKSTQGFALYRDYSKEGADTKLKRLIRE